MRRREVISLLGSGVAAAWPLAARAQQRGVPRIGYISSGSPGANVGNAGLRQGLMDRGYVVGRNLMIEERYAGGNLERIPALIAELLALNIDVLVTPGTPTTQAAQRATTTVPIVCMSGNPVGSGLVASLSHPGGNITGMSLLSDEYSARWLELLTKAAPNLHRVAVLWNPDNVATIVEGDHLKDSARVLGLELTVLSARPSEMEASLAALTPATADGFVVTDDTFLESRLPRLIALAADRRLPALYAFSNAVQQGGLMSYSANFFAMWRNLAGYVDRILKGDRPADLPIEQATEVALQINLKTAKALGLTIPATLLVTADELIE
jgi:putative tryptophan/tyrosine transport system substrate-binding protein